MENWRAMASRRVYPGGVPYSINYPEIPLYAFLENSARKFPGRDALVFYGSRIAYWRVWDGALRLAKALKELGLEGGERVGMLLPNVPQFVISFNAILAAGGVAVPVNPLNPKEEVGRELSETGSDILIVLDRLLHKLPEERPETQIVAEAAAYTPLHLRLLSRMRHGGTEPPAGALRFEMLLRGQRLGEPAEVEAVDDLAAILYTAGTTGRPKGVMLTHYNLVANALQSYHWLRGWGYSGKPQPAGWPVVVCAVPFFHSYGLNVMDEAVQFGCTLVLIPDPQPEEIMRAIQRHRATHFPSIPRFVREVLSHPDLGGYDLTSLTSCSSGGAPIEPGLMRRFEEVTGASFYQGYGLTEAGPSTHATPVGGEPKYGSAGLPLPDTEARVVDPQMGEVEMPPGVEGELVVRGPQVMKGYWGAPEETAGALREGWLYTGDIARIDGEGWLYVVGRKRDRIVAGGHTVWPQEVEEVLKAHPCVESAVAVGAPDPMRCATDVQAVVTLRPGAERAGIEEELMALCRGRLEPYKVPGHICVEESLPMTPMGKVDRLAVEAELERLIRDRIDRATEGS